MAQFIQALAPISAFPLEGIRAATTQFEKSAAAIARGELDAQHFADIIKSQRIVEANVAAQRREDEVFDSLLDTVA